MGAASPVNRTGKCLMLLCVLYSRENNTIYIYYTTYYPPRPPHPPRDRNPKTPLAPPYNSHK